MSVFELGNKDAHDMMTRITVLNFTPSNRFMHSPEARGCGHTRVQAISRTVHEASSGIYAVAEVSSG